MNRNHVKCIHSKKRKEKRNNSEILKHQFNQNTTIFSCRIFNTYKIPSIHCWFEIWFLILGIFLWHLNSLKLCNIDDFKIPTFIFISLQIVIFSYLCSMNGEWWWWCASDMCFVPFVTSLYPLQIEYAW